MLKAESGRYWEARIIEDPENPKTSFWVPLLDSKSHKIHSDSYEGCLMDALKCLDRENRQSELPHLLIVGIVTFPMMPTFSDLTDLKQVYTDTKSLQVIDKLLGNKELWQENDGEDFMIDESSPEQ